MPHDGPCREGFNPRLKGTCYKCGLPISEPAPQVYQGLTEAEFQEFLGDTYYSLTNQLSQLSPAMERNESWAFEAYQKISVLLNDLQS